MWNWLKDEQNQGALKIIGGALATVVVAAWAVFGWLHSQPPSIAGSVCRGEDRGKCPGTDFVGCDTPDAFFADHIKKCKWFEEFHAKQISSRDGNKCGYNVWEYSCNTKW